MAPSGATLLPWMRWKCELETRTFFSRSSTLAILPARTEKSQPRQAGANEAAHASFPYVVWRYSRDEDWPPYGCVFSARVLMPDRFRELDGLRGIAAVAVLLHHATLAGIGEARHEGVLGLLEGAFIRAGHPAVILFFVLSGFVLSLPSLQGRAPGYLGFAIRRLCRIWPPVVFAVLVAWALRLAVDPQPSGGDNRWLAAVWTVVPSPTDVIRHIGLLAVELRDVDLNPPIWSLAYELRLSLLVPFLVLLPRHPLASLAIGAAVYLAADQVLKASSAPVPPLVAGSVGGIVAATAFYLPAFLFGIATARVAVAMKTDVAQPIGIAVLAAIGIAALYMTNDLALMLAAVVAIIACLRTSLIRSALVAAPIQWLGRVSYSLYLIHVPVALALTHLLQGRLPSLVLVLCIVAVSLPAAALTWYLVEAPSQRLGRRLAYRV